jgi:hypothetical protein
LRAWCAENKNKRYIPEWLLKAWRLQVDTVQAVRKQLYPPSYVSLQLAEDLPPLTAAVACESRFGSDHIIYELDRDHR